MNDFSLMFKHIDICIFEMRNHGICDSIMRNLYGQHIEMTLQNIFICRNISDV